MMGAVSFQNKVPTGRVRSVLLQVPYGQNGLGVLHATTPSLEQEFRVETYTCCGGSSHFVWEPIPEHVVEGPTIKEFPHLISGDK